MKLAFVSDSQQLASCSTFADLIQSSNFRHINEKSDDCDVITHFEVDLQLMDCFSAACDGIGLIIILKKIVAMYQPAPGEICVPTSTYVNGKKLEVVDTFFISGEYTLSRDNMRK